MDRMLTGTISTRTVNSRENQVSAEKTNILIHDHDLEYKLTEKVVKE